ncbi:MAG: DoxX family protein [Chitinophagales bacterium]
MTVQKLFLFIGIAAAILTLLRVLLKANRSVLITFLQNFVGSLFIFSGFVKAIDPMGTSYKMHEYFEAMHIEFFNPISTPLTVLMLVAELALGVALLIGWMPRLTTILMLLLNVFFLLLTGYTYLSGFSPTVSFFAFAVLTFSMISMGVIVEKKSARRAFLISGVLLLAILLLSIKYSTLFFTSGFEITKMKVTDCGCFGDFMKLKPWQTFYKDVLLTVMIFIVALYHQKIQPVFSNMIRHTLAIGTAIATLFFCLYNFVWNEPIIDFRPYAIGNDLNEMRREIKPEKKDYVFVYKNKKTGEEKEFKTAELTAITEDWEYKDRKDIVVEEGIPARISNLYIFNDNKEDITDSLLHRPNYSLAVVAWKLSNTHDCCFKNHLVQIADDAKRNGVEFYGLSSENADAFKKKNQLDFPFYIADETPLKTIMRSNPGLVLLKNGVVINKWHHKHLPKFEDLKKQYPGL